MHRMRVWSAALIIAAVLVVGFVLSVPHVRDLGKRPDSAAQTALPVVYVHDSYKKGAHTISAKVVLPDACTSISGVANVVPSTASGTPDTITLTLDMPPDSGVCLEEPATTTLSFTASAAATAVITASINGNDASTTRY